MEEWLEMLMKSDLPWFVVHVITNVLDECERVEHRVRIHVDAVRKKHRFRPNVIHMVVMQLASHGYAEGVVFNEKIGCVDFTAVHPRQSETA